MGVGAGAGRFLWDDYLGLFAKAEREATSLRAAMDRDVMFNFLCTITHIYDWITRDPRFQGLPRHASTEARQLLGDPAVRAIRELCNGAKHLDLGKPERPPPRVRHSVRHWFERPLASVRRSWRLPLSEGETKYLVEVDGKERNVLEVGQEVLTKWSDLLRKYAMPVPA